MYLPTLSTPYPGRFGPVSHGTFVCRSLRVGSRHSSTFTTFYPPENYGRTRKGSPQPTHPPVPLTSVLQASETTTLPPRALQTTGSLFPSAVCYTHIYLADPPASKVFSRFQGGGGDFLIPSDP